MWRGEVARMIHYHGGPIWPEQSGAVIWKGRHGFVSFARPEQIGVIADACQSFAIDNGAFTAWKAGKKFDYVGYEEFVESWMRHPGFDWCLIPDVIDGDEAENLKLVDGWGLPKSMSVPVWHLHESPEYLEYLVGNFPRVAFGSSGQYGTPNTKKWWERMNVAMKVVCNVAGEPCCKLHGLRMLNPAVFTKLPFSSADSTNVAQNAKDSKKWHGSYKPPNNTSRGCLLADRIESQNSAAYWNQKPIQQDMWM